MCYILFNIFDIYIYIYIYCISVCIVSKSSKHKETSETYIKSEIYNLMWLQGQEIAKYNKIK